MLTLCCAAEAGIQTLRKEFDASYKKSMKQKDPYMLAMMANASLFTERSENAR